MRAERRTRFLARIVHSRCPKLWIANCKRVITVTAVYERWLTRLQIMWAATMNGGCWKKNSSSKLSKALSTAKWVRILKSKLLKHSVICISGSMQAYCKVLHPDMQSTIHFCVSHKKKPRTSGLWFINQPRKTTKQINECQYIDNKFNFNLIASITFTSSCSLSTTAVNLSVLIGIFLSFWKCMLLG